MIIVWVLAFGGFIFWYWLLGDLFFDIVIENNGHKSFYYEAAKKGLSNFSLKSNLLK
jgi:hypothetical protein